MFGLTNDPKHSVEIDSPTRETKDRLVACLCLLESTSHPAVALEPLASAQHTATPICLSHDDAVPLTIDHDRCCQTTLGYHTPAPRSGVRPSGSRPLYAGHRLPGKQVSGRLVPKADVFFGLDDILLISTPE